MIAKLVRKHQNTNADCRYIDIGDDFKVYSVLRKQLYDRYGNVIEKILNNEKTEIEKCKKTDSESKDRKSTFESGQLLSVIITTLFDFEMHNAIVYDSINNDFYEELKEVETVKDFFDITWKYGVKDLTNDHIQSITDCPIILPDTGYDRYTAIEYTNKDGKTIIEEIYCKDVYIINNNGKTVEAYRTNFCG